MSFAFERRSDPAAASLRARILDALPAGGYQMDRFFQLLDLEVSREVQSAAVLCGDRPKLLLNPDFVARFCTTDEHLFLLVMHELMHVVLGHTRLFRRPTMAHNVAFDAVINAMLCRQFPGADYVGFFQAINDWEDFPGRLLRPAPGWPASPAALPEGAREAERTLHARLYGSEAKDVTYHEIFELLAAALREAEAAREAEEEAELRPRTRVVRGGGASGPEGADDADDAGDDGATGDGRGGTGAPRPEQSARRVAAEPTLLGSHGPDEHDAADDPTLRDVLRRTIAEWPAPFREIGRDRGTPAQELELSSRERAERELELAIERLFQRAGLQEAHSARTHRREVRVGTVEFGTVVPQLRDRRARLRSSLSGTPAVFYEGQRSAPRVLTRPICRAFVYLDVSGSMDAVLPRLLASLRRPVREGAARLFAFSTIVDEVNPRSLDTARAKSTSGTDVNCVLAHVLEVPPRKSPKRIVLLTDGFVGTPDRALVLELARRGIEVITGLTPPWERRYVAQLAGHVERLPVLGGATRTRRSAKSAARGRRKGPRL
ncbi:MAG: hypothetical protein NTY35_00040 [Planctomycetota bacterium]|nr:hypothetical protein [Planctomycetota bacterium]